MMYGMRIFHCKSPSKYLHLLGLGAKPQVFCSFGLLGCFVSGNVVGMHLMSFRAGFYRSGRHLFYVTKWSQTASLTASGALYLSGSLERKHFAINAFSTTLNMNNNDLIKADRPVLFRNLILTWG